MKNSIRMVTALLITFVFCASLVSCGKSPATTLPTTTIPASISPTIIAGDFFTQIAAEPEKYNGQAVSFTGFYFSGFEITVVCESLEPQEGWQGNYTPGGIEIWATGSFPESVVSKLYVQPNNPTGYPAYYGKVEITGVFEYGGKYGHMDAYHYLLNITEVKLVDWKPGDK